MSNIVKSTLRTESHFTDDGRHRLLLKKVWNSKQPLVTVITKFPNYDGDIKVDLTTQLIINNVSDMGFGGVQMVNLCSNMQMHKQADEVEDFIHEDTDKFILKAIESSDTVIFAWGSITSKIFSVRVKDIHTMLEPYPDKIRVLINPSSKKLCHPLTPAARSLWMVEKGEIRSQSDEKQTEETSS